MIRVVTLLCVGSAVRGTVRHLFHSFVLCLLFGQRIVRIVNFSRGLGYYAFTRRLINPLCHVAISLPALFDAAPLCRGCFPARYRSFIKEEPAPPVNANPKPLNWMRGPEQAIAPPHRRNPLFEPRSPYVGLRTLAGA